TGRGGLPEDPTTTLRGRTVWQDLRDSSGERQQAEASVEHPQARFSDRSLGGARGNRSPHLVEATGWVRDELGNVVLVATEATSAYRLRSPQCQDLSSVRSP
ncbi:MAG TPA: hypothetical protein V6C93_12840, partial [Allocoleopsis sp.]